MHENKGYEDDTDVFSSGYSDGKAINGRKNMHEAVI